jgi:interferon-induced GTP-binding protein Mx1
MFDHVNLMTACQTLHVLLRYNNDVDKLALLSQVMGDQSSGKSSVLEALSGIPFPRGTGLTTRCATQLTMKSVPEGQPWRASVSVDWAQAQPAASGSVDSPAALSKKIEELTNVLCEERGQTFSMDSIVVRVESPESPDLTVIDLPGIVRTATMGQDASVIGQVNALIANYLKQDRTIVLAVVPANQDIATIDILERARFVDPEGVRTIGVLTKPDLVGPGSEGEVLTVLRNERKPLKLG